MIFSWLTTEHFLPWVSWHSEVVVFLGVLLLAWKAVAQVWHAPGPHTIALPLAAAPFIGLSVVVAIQWASGLLPFGGDVWLLCFYAILCVACLALGFAAAGGTGACRSLHASGPFKLLAWAVLLGGLASTLIAFAQVFSLWEQSGWIVRMPYLRRPGGNLAQPNHLATLQVMGVASVVFLRTSLGGLARGLALFLLCAGMAATESRTGALSLLALLAWWMWKRRDLGYPASFAWEGLATGAAYIAMLLAWPHVLNAVDLFGQKSAGRLTEGNLRLEVWSQLLGAAGMHPWTGWGFRQVVAAHNAVVDRYALSEPYAYSHNLVLDLLIWVGAPLAALFVGASVIYLWRRARAASQLLPWYGLAVALPLAVHSMFEYPFAYAYFLAPVMFLLGAVEASTGAKPLARMGVKSTSVLLAAITAVMGWSVVEYLKIEEDFRVARFQSLRIGSAPLEHQQPKVILFDQLGVLLAAARITPAPAMSAEAMQVVKKAALYYSWSATQYRYAVSLALNGNPMEATRQLKVIRVIWGEKVYKEVQQKIDELAATRYPELQQLRLP